MPHAQTTTKPAAQASSPHPPSDHKVVIKPVPGWVLVDFHAMAEYKDLLQLLVLRDLKGRYKQSILGPFWAILSPMISMILFAFVFGAIAQMPSDGVPYPLFALAATVPWALFTGSVSSASSSLVGHANLIRKVYFPRLFLPLAGALVALVDFFIAFAVMIGVIAVWPFLPGVQIDTHPELMLRPHMLFLPVLVLLSMVTAMGIGLWLAALMVQFRDIQKLTGYFLTAWMYMTPLVYPRSTIQNPTGRMLYDFNPMTPVIEGFRWVLYDTPTAPTWNSLWGVAIALVMFFTGIMFFNRMEKTFADVA